MIRGSVGRRRGRPQFEGLESRLAMTVLLGGSVVQNLGSAPIAGRTVFVDAVGDGKFDAGDPSAVTAADGSFSIPVPDSTPLPATLRVVPFPGDFPVPASASASPGQAATLKVQPTGSVLPLSYTATPYQGGTSTSVVAEVTGLYRTILGRAPDQAGFDAALSAVRNGVAMGSLAANLLDSSEYLTSAVAAVYRNDLGRSGAPAEIAAWVALLRKGMTEEQLAFYALTSDEYNRLHASDAEFAQSLFANTLGRTGGPAEVAALASGLGKGLTRPQAVSAYLRSTEAEARAVQGMYATFLGRVAEPAGLALYVGLLQQGVTQSWLAAAFAGSAEYARHAAAASVPSALVAAPNRYGYAFGANGILYISDGANIDRYDTLTGASLSPFVVGGDLLGIDLSPDGKTLAVADSAKGGFDLVDASTGAVTPVYYKQDSYEAGSYSVAWGADGSVLVDGEFKGSGWVPLRRYDPATATFTTIASVRQDSMLSPSADRKTIGIVESNSSDGPIDIYSVAAGKFIATTGDGAFNSVIATNADGTQFVVPTYFGAYVYTLKGGTLYQQTTLGAYASHGPIGAAYSPTSHYLFTAEYDYDGKVSGVKVYDTKTYAQVATLDSYAFGWAGGQPGDGLMRVSPDGRTLAVSVGGGTKVFDVTAYSA